MANFSGSYSYIFLFILLGVFTVVPAVIVIFSGIMFRRALLAERAKRAGYPDPIRSNKDTLIPLQGDTPQKRDIPTHLKEDKLRKKAMQCENCTWEWEHDQNSDYCAVCGTPAPVDKADR